jgi:hypothetical protein
VIGAGIAAAGYVIYNAFGKIKAAFAAVDWNKVRLFAAGAMDALMKGDWARVATHIKEAWREVSPAIVASLNAIRTEALAAYNKLVDQLDGIFPNFEGFRASIVNLGSAIKEFWNEIAPTGDQANTGIEALKKFALALGDAAFQLAADILNAIADGIRALTAAIKAFKEGYGDGGAFEGLKSVLSTMSGDFRLFALSAGLWGMATALGAIKTAMTGLKGINMMAMFAGLGPVKIFLAAAAIGYLADKLGALNWVNEKLGTSLDWVDAFAASLLALSLGKMAASFFASGATAATTAGTAAGASWGTGFLAGLSGILKGGAIAALLTTFLSDAKTLTDDEQKKVNQQIADDERRRAEGKHVPTAWDYFTGNAKRLDNELRDRRVEMEDFLNPSKYDDTYTTRYPRNATMTDSERSQSRAFADWQDTQVPQQASEGWNVLSSLKGILYELTADTRKNLFADTPINNSVQAIRDAAPASAPGQKPGEGPIAIAELKTQTSAASRAAAASEQQNGKIDQSNNLLSQIASGISGLQNVMSTIPGALAKAASANIRANATNPGANKVSTNGLTSPTTLGHR